MLLVPIWIGLVKNVLCVLIRIASLTEAILMGTDKWVSSWENLLMPYGISKGADQPAHLRSLISPFVVHCLDNIISLVSISETSSLYLASVAAQDGLSLPWSQTRRQVFSWPGPYYLSMKNCKQVAIYYHQIPTLLCEPCHEKIFLVHIRTTKAQISLHRCAVWSVSLLFTAWIV